MEILILGAGTAGTAAAAALSRRLPTAQITIVDVDDEHVYQPGLLLVPFGVYSREQMVKPRHVFIPPGVTLIRGIVDGVDPGQRQVTLVGGDKLKYDHLLIATGMHPHIAATPGLGSAPNAHHFYTLEGALSLEKALAGFNGGKLLVGITSLPTKCPVAPVEFAFLAEKLMRRRGVRKNVEIDFYTPLRGAFPRTTCSIELGHMLLERGIPLDSEFFTKEITNDTLIAEDGRRLEYDLLVTSPVHMGADYVGRSGLGSEHNTVPVDPITTLALGFENIWVLGDAGDSEAPKAGAVITYQMPIFLRNLQDVIAGKEPSARYDGHVNCFIESGGGKALIVDFNFETDALRGFFLVPVLGPPLLKASWRSHFLKLAFRHIYWHALLRGLAAGVHSGLVMFGKRKR